MKTQFNIDTNIHFKQHFFSRMMSPKTCYATKHTYIEKYNYCGKPQIEAYYYITSPSDHDTIISNPLYVTCKHKRNAPAEAFDLAKVTSWYDPKYVEVRE